MACRLRTAGWAAAVFALAVSASCSRDGGPDFQAAGTRIEPALVDDPDNRLSAEILGTWNRDRGFLKFPGGARAGLFDSIALRRDPEALKKLPGILEPVSAEIEKEHGRRRSESFLAAAVTVHQCGRAEAVKDGKRLESDFFLFVLSGMPHLFFHSDDGRHQLFILMAAFEPDSDADFLFLGDWINPHFVSFYRSSGPAAGPEAGLHGRDPGEGGDEEEGGEEEGPFLQDAEVKEADPAASKARQWVEDVQQIGDERRKLIALDEIRSALASNDESLQIVALMAVACIGDVNYDKASMRPLVLRFLESKNAEARAAAMYALVNTVVEPGDAAMFLGMAADPSPAVRGKVTHILGICCKGDLRGDASDAVLKLLNDKDSNVADDSLRNLWGAQVSQNIQDKLLAMADTKDRDRKQMVYYFGLSTLMNKSKAVIDALVRGMQGSDYEIQGRSMWGLSHGIPEEHHETVADAFTAMLHARSDQGIQSQCLRNIGEYGGDKHLEDLEQFAANPLVNGELKSEAERAIAFIRRRQGK